MLHNKGKDIDNSIFNKHNIPKYEIGENPIDPKRALKFVRDELLGEGNAHQNLATFCQTTMEDEAVELMATSLEKNAVDKSEYPRTTELENRCVNMIASLWNASSEEKFIGTSTVGSSEACMLGGMAMKFNWRHRVSKLGLDLNKQKPNIVISSAFQVCWEKFCVYYDIELRAVPITSERMCLDLNSVLDYVDEFTIGVVGILGITYTGKYDDIYGLDKLLEGYNSKTDFKVYIHVDAASGGMFAPFVNPELLWDFRLKNVVSINTSGHKYGLVYPGIGWAVWRDESFLPKELIFSVSYLGGDMPTMAINFSRSASQIIGQYYNLLRFGFNGYRSIHEKTKKVALYLSSELDKIGLFDIYNDGGNLPVVCYSLKNNLNLKWTLYDLSDFLLLKGWQVPSYPLPANLDNTIIQRFVCRADLSFNLAITLVEDLKRAIEELNNAHLLYNHNETKKHGYTH